MKRIRIPLLGGLLLAVLPVILLSACSHERSVQIALGGDIMLAREGSPIFSEVAVWGEAQSIFEKSDLSMANLESPITDLNTVIYPQQGYNLCSPVDGLEFLKASGVQYYSLNNNHSGDCGEDGLLTTQKLLDETSLKGFSQEPLEIRRNGQAFSLISVEDVTKALDLSPLVESIQKEKRKGNFVIISVHWGNEYQAGADARQQEIAQALTDAGADLIWGHHPHVLQRMEWLEGENAHRTLVVYSLGNLVSDQAMLRDAQRTAVITLTVKNGKINNLQAIPFILDMGQHRLIRVEKEEAAFILDRLDESIFKESTAD